MYQKGVGASLGRLMMKGDHGTTISSLPHPLVQGSINSGWLWVSGRWLFTVFSVTRSINVLPIVLPIASDYVGQVHTWLYMCYESPLCISYNNNNNNYTHCTTMAGHMQDWILEWGHALSDNSIINSWAHEHVTNNHNVILYYWYVIL